MKKILAKALPLLFLLLISEGCSLFPKSVEYFQKSVKAVPTASSALQENQKQAAQAVDSKIQEARIAAAETRADPSVQVPLAQAAPVARALTYSLGPPISLWTDNLTNLADSLNTKTAKLDKKVDDYAKDVQPLVGKKIEDTGLFKIGYFTQIGLLFGLGALVWFGLKVYGVFNPAVGTATSVVGRVSSKVLHAGFHQVVAGGEKFKELVEKANKSLSPDEIKELFAQAHERSQDQGVQDLIKQITA